MLKGIIFSLITGLVGGLVLHFAEYAFFIPIFMHKSNFVPKKPPPLNSMPCKCTPGNIFHDRLADGNVGPKMVVIGAGCFRMGNLQTEKDNELPIHKVSVNSFAMSRYEISFAEYDRFAQKTHRALPDDNNWGRGQRPVINV
ncbi:MAG: SUMF1/EgtB/PvdO family nonheme iron enzyme, partial [Thiomargarita sp.]|nr:SUMF1/EgtB/PvdO family nonheme iron enzyme [Thiomargarita sp.]